MLRYQVVTNKKIHFISEQPVVEFGKQLMRVVIGRMYLISFLVVQLVLLKWPPPMTILFMLAKGKTQCVVMFLKV